ncbi:MAG: class I SAM-dependent methyltransferase [Bacteroidales bacterium]|nr:class I SAM-dependent methyltransferase [Bacteroidales bacterium]
MSNDNKSIHEFDINLLCEYFSVLERQCPGSPEVTIKALSFIDNLTDSSCIVDLGCGTGGQTMTLAKHAPGHTTGIDLFPHFIDLFNKNAKKLGLHNKVKGITGSMESIPFKQETIDLIWSEGAIYNIGFERGIKEWWNYLKNGGYIAVTEATWFTDRRPDEITSFWMDAYPEIDTIPKKVALLQKAGYIPVASFILPENCWTEHFYTPQVAAQDIFITRYKENEMVAELVAYQRHEAALYEKYKAYYGYVFFIGKKVIL